MTRAERLRAQALEAVTAAKAIAQKADDERRALTSSEDTEYRRHMTTAKSLAKDLEAEVGNQLVMEQAKAWALGLDAPLAGDRDSGWARAAAKAMTRGAQDHGVKSLTSGTVEVPNPISVNVVRNAEAPRTVLDLITTRKRVTTNEWGYLRQTTRQTNARFVPDGAVKPTSVYTLKAVEDRVRVLAHLSEPIPERFFADYADLERFLTVEMENGLQATLDQQIVAGDGTGENLAGILATSGTVAVTYDTDPFVTARKAIGELRAMGENPGAFIVSPDDDVSIDTAREDGSTGAFLSGAPANTAASALWGIPRVVSHHLPVGTAILGDFDFAELVVREEAVLTADRSGDNFDRNLVKLRLEGRYGFAITRPSAFAVVDLAA